MAATKPTYDLVLLLDTGAPDEQRKKILTDAESLIKQHGEIVGDHDWGTRATAYELNKKTDAEYHLVQFHGTSELLATLDRTLRITDGVLRFRIIKLAPGTPAPPESPEQAPGTPAAAAAAAPPAPAAEPEADDAPAPVGEPAPAA